MRQVHLDFHTSPHIPDVGAEFDATEIARQFKAAFVDSVTVFAKCHHGMCYYPTLTGTPHPALAGRDLLGELIEALHREGIRAPVYTTVAWEEDVAQRFPAWRQMRADGTFARSGHALEPGAVHPGGWWFNDWSHPDYQDYIEAHVREVAGRYPIDGLFFDILFYAPGAHCSAAARDLRRQWRLETDDAATFRRFELKAQEMFCRRFSQLVRDLSPRASIFYNASVEVGMDSRESSRVRLQEMTQFEIESLPSGFWGYFHFPRSARAIGNWGKPWLGMTGRFQRMWGDFGGIKPTAALEYECFRTQALGGGNSVGDQLPPRGRLDAAAIRLIGEVYRQCAHAEPFYAGSMACPQVGILTAAHCDRPADDSMRSDEGAVQMLEESHYDAAVLDDASSLRGLDLLVLPDSTVITPRMRERLRRYHRAGGKLVLSHHAGRNAAGEWMLDFLPLSFHGDATLHPSYWRCRERFWPEMSVSDRVVYSAGTCVRGGRGTAVWVDRVMPYFPRTDLTFCSHFQTPPQSKTERYPAVLAGKGFVYFADPIFREYRRAGNTALRDVWKRAMRELIGPPPVGDGLPTTVTCYARRRGRDLLLTLLHYVPLRKALDVDVLEERMGFGGERLRFSRPVRLVRIFDIGENVEAVGDGEFVLPTQKGRLLLEVPDYFRPGKG